MAVKVTYAVGPDPQRRHFLVDTFAELPATGLNEGDTAYAKDTDREYVATGPTTWVIQEAGHEASADPHTVYQKESEKAAASGYASLDAGTKVPLAQLPTGTTNATVALGDAAAAMDTTHAGAADPHAGYVREADANWTDLTDAGETALHTHAGGGAHPDLATHDALGLSTDAELTTHAGAADPHTVYQKESEKAAVSGYASLDAGTKVPIAQVPTGTTAVTVALGDAAAALDATHAAAADPHTGYVKENDASWTDLTDAGETALHSHAGGGAHPDLATHDALGLSTDTELTTHAATAHGGLNLTGTSGAAGTDRTTLCLIANSADNTTTTQVVAMTITGVGAGTWRVKGALIWQTAATATGIGIVLDHTGTVTRFVSNLLHITTGGTAATGVSDQATTTATGQLAEGKAERVKNTRSSFIAGVDTQNADELAVMDAVIIVTVTGSVTLSIASEVGGSAVRLMAGSTLEIDKVA